jgi:FkbM family methyltransferase
MNMSEARDSHASGLLSLALRFWQKPLREKVRSIGFRWASLRLRWRRAVSNIPMIPVPVRLPFGAWWLARNDHIGRPIRKGIFETTELDFVERFLQPGMTVLDLGAHHGLYTLLASKRVGPTGRVLAFEPSPRERRALRLHVKLNRCTNVIVQELALGDVNTESDLYRVQHWASGCNSLRPPDVPARTSLVRVRVARLDDWLAEQKISCVDFVKLDVEGAELGTLKGAARLLERRPRPIILAEVQDIRTLPWGYPAKQIIEYLGSKGYKWFVLSENGSIHKLDITLNVFEGNFVACPEEALGALQRVRPVEPCQQPLSQS